MKILVPIDFSELSLNAARYAIRVARNLNGTIQLLYVMDVNPSSQTLLKWKKLEEEIVRTTERDGEVFMRELRRSRIKIPLTFHYVQGHPVDKMVNQFVKKHDIDLVIMGTKGASGLKKVVIGSNAIAVVNNSRVPVITVPEQTKIQPIKRIAYASDLRELEKEVKTLSAFAQLFNARLQVVHVQSNDAEKEVDHEKILSRIRRLAGEVNVSFHLLHSDNIAEVIDDFIVDQRVDILSMFTHKIDFYGRLFGKSITRKLAFHTHVPLLAFNKTNTY